MITLGKLSMDHKLKSEWFSVSEIARGLKLGRNNLCKFLRHGRYQSSVFLPTEWLGKLTAH